MKTSGGKESTWMTRLYPISSTAVPGLENLQQRESRLKEKAPVNTRKAR
jgi:hypothetical protein